MKQCSDSKDAHVRVCVWDDVLQWKLQCMWVLLMRKRGYVGNTHTCKNHLIHKDAMSVLCANMGV